ncbi:hypothetical protein BV392_04420 [Rhodovulum sulfidophilum]|nr:pentapeptide repeat-containing protein [Rhodovulum sulfidophilum]OLS51317.1 hypothetical protein BV392_04420 [Rhodovulum sulfidophilum]
MRKRDAYRARKSVLKNKTRPVRSEAGTSVGRIDALTRNARNTWFALLGLLVFVGITLMSVEHIDFYGIDRATKLPLVNVDVPTRYFFVAAPILTAAFYIYFHLHLIRLWDALGAADNRIGGQPLGDAVMPWLVTDAALHLRNLWRADDCCTPRALDRPATVLNLALTWGFGLIVLGLLWWMSMPARTFWMTAIACAALLAAAGAGLSSLGRLVERMGPDEQAWQSWPSTPVVMTVIVSIAFSSSYLRTAGPIERLAPIDMTGLAIVEKPTGWLPRDIAKADFFAAWCKREGTDCTRKELSEDQKNLFEREFRRRRGASLSDIRKPQWHQPGHQKPDFRGAQLAGAFLAGAELRWTHMEEADLRWAQMEGADLRGAQMAGANLSMAQMEGANLSMAQMEGANLSMAQMEGAVLSGAQMEGAVLSGAQMAGTDLIDAQMAGAFLSGAQLEGANLRGAQMEGANLRGAQMAGAFLFRAQMEGTDLIDAQMTGAVLSGAQMAGANLRGAQLEGALVSEAQLEGANLSGAQLEGAVLIDAQMEGANLSGAQMEGANLSGAQSADGGGEPQRGADGGGEPQRCTDGEGGPHRCADGGGGPQRGADGGGEPQRCADGGGGPQYEFLDRCAVRTLNNPIGEPESGHKWWRRSQVRRFQERHLQ